MIRPLQVPGIHAAEEGVAFWPSVIVAAIGIALLVWGLYRWYSDKDDQ